MEPGVRYGNRFQIQRVFKRCAVDQCSRSPESLCRQSHVEETHAQRYEQRFFLECFRERLREDLRTIGPEGFERKRESPGAYQTFILMVNPGVLFHGDNCEYEVMI